MEEKAEEAIKKASPKPSGYFRGIQELHQGRKENARNKEKGKKRAKEFQGRKKRVVNAQSTAEFKSKRWWREAGAMWLLMLEEDEEGDLA